MKIKFDNISGNLYNALSLSKKDIRHRTNSKDTNAFIKMRANGNKRAKPSTHHGAKSEDIPLVLRQANLNNLLVAPRPSTIVPTHAPGSSEQPCQVALFYDLDAFDESLEALKTSFGSPSHWRHCLAVKANPLLKILQMAVERGFGLECASIVEVELSIKAGCRPDFVVYDSPCKTVSELRRALHLGVQINCDGFDEIERVARILLDERIPSKSVIGVRINPLLGMGNIRALSVSDATSKFGIPFTDENKTRIIQYFSEYPFLNALHVHVGSQGCSLEMLASGASAIYNLAEELGGSPRIKVLDIGGGLPTNFDSDETTPSFEAYAQVLRKMVPKLFSEDNKYIVVTEFGRSMHAKLGWVASTCELVKEAGGRRIAVIHVGSDMFVRTCYCPKDFPLRVEIVDGEKFELKQGETQEHNVVGPLCFGGDKICEAKMLPKINSNDIVVVRDAGANCLSLWSRHCSRPSPPVFGYRIKDTCVELVQLRKQESLEQVLSFWE